MQVPQGSGSPCGPTYSVPILVSQGSRSPCGPEFGTYVRIDFTSIQLLFSSQVALTALTVEKIGVRPASLVSYLPPHANKCKVCRAAALGLNERRQAPLSRE